MIAACLRLRAYDTERSWVQDDPVCQEDTSGYTRHCNAQDSANKYTTCPRTPVAPTGVTTGHCQAEGHQNDAREQQTSADHTLVSFTNTPVPVNTERNMPGPLVGCV